MSSELAMALASLRSIDLADDRIRVIKDSVARAIELSDPGARVSRTEYFNHAAVPDLVVKWPKGEPTRCLYLRGNADPVELMDGLPFIEPRNAILLPLSSMDEYDVTASAKESLDAAARERGAWILEPAVVDVLATSRQERSPSASLVGQALIRGGEGVTSVARSQQLIRTVEAGFVGAGELDGTAVEPALGVLREALDVRQASRLERVLRAVWEGNGGRPIDFPGGDSLGALSDDDLLYLLDSVTDDSLNFWRRIGGAVSTRTPSTSSAATGSRTL